MGQTVNLLLRLRWFESILSHHNGCAKKSGFIGLFCYISVKNCKSLIFCLTLTDKSINFFIIYIKIGGLFLYSVQFICGVIYEPLGYLFYSIFYIVDFNSGFDYFHCVCDKIQKETK